jgi:cell division protein FtsA
VEIVEQVFAEIKAYGHEDPRKKLIAGIVLTGGGAQLKHIKQLVEYITGMDTRIGYPNEHLAGNSSEEISSPLFATAVGLVMNSIENSTQSAVRMELVNEQPKVVYRNVNTQPQQPVQQRYEVEENYVERVEAINEPREIRNNISNKVTKDESTETKIRRSFFDRYVDKIKDFLDNAE